MKVLIVGGGGREHAIAWKIIQSPKVEHVFVAPGNSGTHLESNVSNIAIPTTDIPELIDFAKKNEIALTIVGPEAPLAAGIVDQFEAAGLACFGPSQAAAQLESSKTFSKDFMRKHNIPTALYASFTDAESAKVHVRAHGTPIVIKADGLATGKGVVIAKTEQEAFNAIDAMLKNNLFGTAGKRIVIEEFISGEEASFIVVVDGEHVLPLVTSQDHKTRDDGDTGPNTGGMGAYSPAPVITPELHELILRDVIYPTVKGLADQGTPYKGFLYAGVMITPNGSPKVLEFNCRCGDPETQPIMLRLQSDLAEICLAAIEGRLNTASATWDSRTAVGVVLAAGGYPASYRKGDIIMGLENNAGSDYKIFHAGAKTDGDNVVTAGGRVLCVTALGDTTSQAQSRAYEIINRIDWQDMYYRTDIAHRAIERERALWTENEI